MDKIIFKEQISTINWEVYILIYLKKNYVFTLYQNHLECTIN